MTAFCCTAVSSWHPLRWLLGSREPLQLHSLYLALEFILFGQAVWGQVFLLHSRSCTLSQLVGWHEGRRLGAQQRQLHCNIAEERKGLHVSVLPAIVISFCYRGTSIMCRVGATAGVVEGASRCLCQCKCLLEYLTLHCPSAMLA